jgi:hypothetical protein
MLLMLLSAIVVSITFPKPEIPLIKIPEILDINRFHYPKRLFALEGMRILSRGTYIESFESYRLILNNPTSILREWQIKRIYEHLLYEDISETPEADIIPTYGYNRQQIEKYIQYFHDNTDLEFYSYDKEDMVDVIEIHHQLVNNTTNVSNNAIFLNINDLGEQHNNHTYICRNGKLFYAEVYSANKYVVNPINFNPCITTCVIFISSQNQNVRGTFDIGGYLRGGLGSIRLNNVDSFQEERDWLILHEMLHLFFNLKHVSGGNPYKPVYLYDLYDIVHKEINVEDSMIVYDGRSSFITPGTLDKKDNRLWLGQYDWSIAQVKGISNRKFSNVDEDKIIYIDGTNVVRGSPGPEFWFDEILIHKPKVMGSPNIFDRIKGMYFVYVENYHIFNRIRSKSTDRFKYYFPFINSEYCNLWYDLWDLDRVFISWIPGNTLFKYRSDKLKGPSFNPVGPDEPLYLRIENIPFVDIEVYGSNKTIELINISNAYIKFGKETQLILIGYDPKYHTLIFPNNSHSNIICETKNKSTFLDKNNINTTNMYVLTLKWKTFYNDLDSLNKPITRESYVDLIFFNFNLTNQNDCKDILYHSQFLKSSHDYTNINGRIATKFKHNYILISFISFLTLIFVPIYTLPLLYFCGLLSTCTIINISLKYFSVIHKFIHILVKKRKHGIKNSFDIELEDIES